MTNTPPMREITPGEIKTYQEDGIVCLRGAFSSEWVKILRDAAEVSLAKPTDMSVDLAEVRKDEGRFFHDTFVWRHNDLCRKFVFDSAAAGMAGELLKSEKANLFFDQWLIKEPGTVTKTPWHQDLPYWPVKGSQIATMWIALDSVTKESGAVEYVKGSQNWHKTYKPASFDGGDQYTEDLPEVPDIEALRDQYDIAQFELEPGDCTFHQGLVVHGSPGNTSANRRRRAYVIRWAGDDVIFEPRDGLQEMPPFPDIAVGGPLDSDLWPRIYG